MDKKLKHERRSFDYGVVMPERRKMKCPVCGINHRKFSLAHCCNSKIDSEFAHYIILCSGMPGGATIENLKSYEKNGMVFDINHFNKVKYIRKQMEEYLKGWKDNV